MAVLGETETYESGIYQLEITDPVVGGANGIDNLQAKQLANRTAWLKKQFTDLFNGAISVVKATKLVTARNINGVAFDGTADITLPAQTTISGNAGTATKLATARNINGVNFDGTADINIEARLGTPIASAATTTIGTVGGGDMVHITGTTTITSFGTTTSANVLRIVVFDGALTLTHNATSLILPTGANILTAAGDVAEFICENTTLGYWKCTGYQRANGAALVSGIASGKIDYFATTTAPTGYLKANGAAVSRATYAALFSAICSTYGAVTSISNGAGAVVTTPTAHGRVLNDPITFTTTGALPTGLVAGTTYYVAGTITSTTFQLSATIGGAVITTSSAGSGVHTLIYVPFGTSVGDTANFLLPDLRGEFIRGWDDARGVDSSRVFGSWQAEQIKEHTGTEQVYSGSANSTSPIGAVSAVLNNPASWGYINTTTNASAQANAIKCAIGGLETRPRNSALLACIKY